MLGDRILLTVVEGTCPVCLVHGERAQTTEVRRSHLIRDYQLTQKTLDVRSPPSLPLAYAADPNSLSSIAWGCPEYYDCSVRALVVSVPHIWVHHLDKQVFGIQWIQLESQGADLPHISGRAALCRVSRMRCLAN